MNNFRTRALGFGLCVTIASSLIASPVAQAQSTDITSTSTEAQPAAGSSFEQCLKSPLLVVLGLAGATGIIGSLMAPMVTPITNSLNAQASQASRDLLGQLGVTDTRPEWLRQIDADLRGVFGAGYQQQLAIPAGILAGAMALLFINDQCGGSLTSSGGLLGSSSNDSSSDSSSTGSITEPETKPANPFEQPAPNGITITNTTYEADGVHVTFSDGTTMVIPKGQDGADGKDGAPGADGAAGADGAPGAPGTPGVDGKDGVDGTSVTIENIVNGDSSTIITYSDGNVVTIPHGKDGTNGTDGKSITVVSSEFDADGNTVITFSDGSTAVVQKGANGICDCIQPAPEPDVCEPVPASLTPARVFVGDPTTGKYTNGDANSTLAGFDTTTIDPATMQLRAYVDNTSGTPQVVVGIFNSTVDQSEVNAQDTLITSHPLSLYDQPVTGADDPAAEAQRIADVLNSMGRAAITYGNTVVGLGIVDLNTLSSGPVTLDSLSLYASTMDHGCNYSLTEVSMARELKIRQ